MTPLIRKKTEQLARNIIAEEHSMEQDPEITPEEIKARIKYHMGSSSENVILSKNVETTLPEQKQDETKLEYIDRLFTFLKDSFDPIMKKIFFPIELEDMIKKGIQESKKLCEKHNLKIGAFSSFVVPSLQNLEWNFDICAYNFRTSQPQINLLKEKIIQLIKYQKMLHANNMGDEQAQKTTFFPMICQKIKDFLGAFSADDLLKAKRNAVQMYISSLIKKINESTEKKNNFIEKKDKSIRKEENSYYDPKYLKIKVKIFFILDEMKNEEIKDLEFAIETIENMKWEIKEGGCQNVIKNTLEEFIGNLPKEKRDHMKRVLKLMDTMHRLGIKSIEDLEKELPYFPLIQSHKEEIKEKNETLNKMLLNEISGKKSSKKEKENLIKEINQLEKEEKWRKGLEELKEQYDEMESGGKKDIKKQEKKKNKKHKYEEEKKGKKWKKNASIRQQPQNNP